MKAVASRLADRSPQAVAPRILEAFGRSLLRTAGRLTNPDSMSRWVLHRLERLPDVAEIV